MHKYAVAALVALSVSLVGASVTYPDRGTVWIAPDTVEAPQVQAANDTLIATEWVQRVLDSWDGTVRYYCISSYASWPHFLFLRHIRETDPQRRCEIGEPVLIQGPVCPDAPLAADGADFVLVECGLRVFRRYDRGVGLPRGQRGGVT
jgi:hypothetical protein